MKMKRTISAVLALLLLAGCLAVSAATIGVVHTPSMDGTVFLRSGAGNGYRALGYADHGDMLTILTSTNSWHRVSMRTGRIRGLTGWMYRKYVTALKDPTDISGWGALAHIKTKYAASSVNLRKGPGTGYGVKDTVYRDDLLIVLDKYNSKWYEVQVVSTLRTGYVSTEYIANGAVGTITASGVNMRKSASTSARVLTTLYNGYQITVLNIGKKWSKIKYGNLTGYVWNEYFRLKNA